MSSGLRDRFQQARLAELVWKICVSDLDLESEIKFFKKYYQNLVGSTFLGSHQFLLVLYFPKKVA